MKTLLLFPLLRLFALVAVLSAALAVEEAAPSAAGEIPTVASLGCAPGPR